jgi:hypothetical protein
MNRRNKEAVAIWGIVAGVLAVGGAIAFYLGGDDAAIGETPAANSQPSSAEGRTPAASARSAVGASGVAESAASSAGAATGAADLAAGAASSSVGAAGAAGAGAASAAAGAAGAAEGLAGAPETAAIPSPSLDDSDAEVRSELNEIVGSRVAAQFLLPDRVVRNVVVTLDNLTQQKASIEQRPVKPTPGKFLTAGSESAPVIAPENYARYEPFIDAVQRLDARKAVAMYRDLQPLFQEAYEELGHPNESFTDRLLDIIEHLLEAPEVEGTIRLAQPGLLYEYADEELQSLSVGKKLMIRLGPKNRAVVKQKLREIRAELV